MRVVILEARPHAMTYIAGKVLGLLEELGWEFRLMSWGDLYKLNEGIWRYPNMLILALGSLPRYLLQGRDNVLGTVIRRRVVVEQRVVFGDLYVQVLDPSDPLKRLETLWPSEYLAITLKKVDQGVASLLKKIRYSLW